jgi:hypothetical protein
MQKSGELKKPLQAGTLRKDNGCPGCGEFEAHLPDCPKARDDQRGASPQRPKGDDDQR